MLEVDLGLDVHCTACGTERDFPEGSERVLEGDALYAETAAPCECGARRVRIVVGLSLE